MVNKIMLQTAAPIYPRSCKFYETLNFVKRFELDQIAVFGDAQFDILVNGQTAVRPGYVCFVSNLESIKERLESMTELSTFKNGLTMTDPNGVWLYLRNDNDPINLSAERPSQKNMCGNYYGTGIETHCFDKSIAFWSALGYGSDAEITDASQYATLTHANGPAITFYKPGNCPHAFYNPSLTFFNGKTGNPIVIENLRSAKINIVEEISIFNNTGEVDNIIISDPGALHFFIYNDG